MANPICLSPLRFYDNTDKWSHKKSYAYGSVAPLIMPFNTIDPFQIVAITSSVRDIDHAYLVDYNTGAKLDLTKELTEIGLCIKPIDTRSLIMFPGIYPLSSVEFEGLYYLELIDDELYHYYSEIFCFSSKTDNLLTIEYWNPESNFELKNGIVSFNNGFHFKLRLNTELGKPEYSFEEEATKRLGFSFIESQVSKKVYKFNAVVPEYVCDAMRIIRLCSNKKVYSLGEEYDAITFDMDVDWQEQGDLASVNCEFETDNVIVNLGGYEYTPLGGDYNKDYNNDFDNA